MTSPLSPSALIIEDNAMSRAILRTALSRVGLTTINEAADGEQGLRMAEALRPSLIFVDVFLPKINGFEVLKRLRQVLSESLVIVVSGHDTEEAVTTAMRLGAAGYLTKPFNYDTLLSQLSGFLR